MGYSCGSHFKNTTAAASATTQNDLCNNAVLFGSIGDSLSFRNDEQTYRNGLEVWKAASKIYSHFSYQINYGTVFVKTDWSKIVDMYATDVKLVQVSGNTNARGGRHPVPVSFSLSQPDGKPMNDVETISVVELFLYDFFSAMNLSVPGCCTFEGVTIVRPERDADTPPVWRPAGFPEEPGTDNLLPMLKLSAV